MSPPIKLGIWRHIVPLPSIVGTKRVEALSRRAQSESEALSDEHRAVHHFVVEALPNVEGPLSPETVAEELRLPLPRVIQILDELEAKKAFLFRDEQGAVTWAYPVTAAVTPHRLTFNSGERLYAA